MLMLLRASCAAFSLEVRLPIEHVIIDFGAPEAVAAWQATCDAQYGGETASERRALLLTVPLHRSINKCI